MGTPVKNIGVQGAAHSADAYTQETASCTPPPFECTTAFRSSEPCRENMGDYFGRRLLETSAKRFLNPIYWAWMILPEFSENGTDDLTDLQWNYLVHRSLTPDELKEVKDLFVKTWNAEAKDANWTLTPDRVKIINGPQRTVQQADTTKLDRSGTHPYYKEKRWTIQIEVLPPPSPCAKNVS